jgi:hypothetical protein
VLQSKIEQSCGKNQQLMKQEDKNQRKKKINQWNKFLRKKQKMK